MSVVAEFALGTDAFSMGEVVAKDPDARLEFEPTISIGSLITPLICVWSSDHESAESSLRGLPEVESVERLNTNGTRGMFEVEWTEETEDCLRSFADGSNVVVLDASTDGDGWRLEVMAKDHEDLRRFREHCAGWDVEAEPVRIYDIDEAMHRNDKGLTPEQYEALVAALEGGYFDEPRRTTLADLGDDLGISRQAFSGRLRRGLRNLVGTSLSRR